MSNNFKNISEDEKLHPNYAEYLIKRGGSKSVASKVGIVLLALVIVIASFVFVLKWVAAAMLPIFVGTMALCWFLWRYTEVEYEYIIISATVEFYKIYGERTRKKICEIKTSSIEKIAPASAHPEIKNAQYAESYDFSNGKNGDDLFFILYNGERGKGIIYINVIKKTLDVFKYYKSNVVEFGNIA